MPPLPGSRLHRPPTTPSAGAARAGAAPRPPLASPWAPRPPPLPPPRTRPPPTPVLLLVLRLPPSPPSRPPPPHSTPAPPPPRPLSPPPFPAPPPGARRGGRILATRSPGRWIWHPYPAAVRAATQLFCMEPAERAQAARDRVPRWERRNLDALRPARACGSRGCGIRGYKVGRVRDLGARGVEGCGGGGADVCASVGWVRPRCARPAVPFCAWGWTSVRPACVGHGCGRAAAPLCPLRGDQKAGPGGRIPEAGPCAGPGRSVPQVARAHGTLFWGCRVFVFVL